MLKLKYALTKSLICHAMKNFKPQSLHIRPIKEVLVCAAH